MNIREFTASDEAAAKNIFAMYWTDPDFLEELTGELHQNPFLFLVAEENGEMVGISGFKSLPEYLKPYARTANPLELYVIAAKYKRKGIGTALKERMIEMAKRHGYSEILLYSPHTHDESWKFHDTLGFERAGEVTPPEDENGNLWRKII